MVFEKKLLALQGQKLSSLQGSQIDRDLLIKLFHKKSSVIKIPCWV